MRWFHNGRKRDRLRRVAVGVLTTLGVSLAVAPVPAQASVSCQELNFPVALGKMFGKLCTPTGAKAVQVLIPGGTYNSSYWDIGYTPEVRSYQVAMNKAGYATLAVDRLGTGRSSKPLSALVTATTQANAVHDVIQSLRKGTLGPKFDKVIVGGHSIGSAMAMIEAGLHQDVDGVVVTGMTHKMNYITVLPVLTNMIPARLDLGYLTTSPGTRYQSFHTPGPLVAGAIDFDESTKDVFAVTEAVDTIALTNVIIPASRLIKVPVLIVLGNDTHFCGLPLGSDCSSAEALRASEAPYFAPEAKLKAYILDGYGHSINYAPNAPKFHDVVATWADAILN